MPTCRGGGEAAQRRASPGVTAMRQFPDGGEAAASLPRFPHPTPDRSSSPRDRPPLSHAPARSLSLFLPARARTTTAAAPHRAHTHALQHFKPIPLAKNALCAGVVAAAIGLGAAAALGGNFGGGFRAAAAPVTVAFFAVLHREIVMDLKDASQASIIFLFHYITLHYMACMMDLKDASQARITFPFHYITWHT